MNLQGWKLQCVQLKSTLHVITAHLSYSRRKKNSVLEDTVIETIQTETEKKNSKKFNETGGLYGKIKAAYAKAFDCVDHNKLSNFWKFLIHTTIF